MARAKAPEATLADATREGIRPDVFHRRWLILSSICGSLLAVMFAQGSLNLALSALATQFKLGTLQLTWIVEIYSLLFASLLFTTSAVGDRYGRKLIMQIGLLLFAASSLYAGFIASTGTELLVVRACMGVGASMVLPTTLSLANVTFPSKERPRAVAIWAGVTGVGTVLGFIVGGLALDHLGWQYVFIISAALAIITLISNQVLCAETRDPKRTPVDWPSSLLTTAGLAGLVYAIMEAPGRGLNDASVLATLIVGCACLIGFVLRQRRIAHPMLDVFLFKHKAFSISAICVLLAYFSLGGVFYSVSQLFMLVMGYRAFDTALSFIPMVVLVAILTPLMPGIIRKIGTRWTVSLGLLLFAATFVVMTAWPTVPSFLTVIGTLMILAVGLTFTVTPATNMMMSAVPKSRSGMGSAVNETALELGAALGVAVLGALLSSGYASRIVSVVSGLPEQLRSVAEKSLAGAVGVAGQMGDTGVGLAAGAKTAWMDSLRTPIIVAAIICAVAAVLSAIWMPHREGNLIEEEEEMQHEVKSL
jgi:EmrB/QacA subfamily drug resistance transporter